MKWHLWIELQSKMQLIWHLEWIKLIFNIQLKVREVVCILWYDSYTIKGKVEAGKKNRVQTTQGATYESLTFWTEINFF